MVWEWIKSIFHNCLPFYWQKGIHQLIETIWFIFDEETHYLQRLLETFDHFAHVSLKNTTLFDQGLHKTGSLEKKTKIISIYNNYKLLHSKIQNDY